MLYLLNKDVVSMIYLIIHQYMMKCMNDKYRSIIVDCTFVTDATVLRIVESSNSVYYYNHRYIVFGPFINDANVIHRPGNLNCGALPKRYFYERDYVGPDW